MFTESTKMTTTVSQILKKLWSIAFVLFCSNQLQWNLSKVVTSSIIERVSSGQGFIIHYVGYKLFGIQ